ncbi:DUF4132 domain-containing protein [Massilia atriviolacea]|uniref:DUF4132 domain-containing protein n=1 Tax=Massilia atriviolacea TaxID=2495579 RepID=A0A430HN68_9BURK|nr:DUF4132 domain-containing protein [Massilia atriviolacea]RSZ58950.1 DUF4132 domain-containing protein [Massilia atriviolacea]
MRRFELSDGVSSKFWEVSQDGSDVTVCFGRIGTAGKAQTKNHQDAATAAAAMAKLIREKTGKGYAETGAAAPAAAAPAPAPAPAPVAAMPAPAVPVPAPAPAPAQDVAPWLAVFPLIDMPDKLMTLALPSRRFPGTPPAIDADASWALFLAHARNSAPLSPELSAEGWRPAMNEAAQRIAHGQRDGSAVSDVVLLALSTTFDDLLAAGDGVPFIDFLVASEGVLYALDALLRMEGISVRQQGLRNPGICIDDNAEQWFAPTEYVFGKTELAMRAHLAHAPQDVWDACVQLVRDVLPSLAPHRRPLFGVLLPDVPALSDAIVAAAAPVYPVSMAWLRLTMRDPASMRALDPIAACDNFYLFCWYDKPEWIATALRDRGTDAVAALRDGANAGVELAADAIAGIGTPEAIRALASIPAKKAIKRLTAAAARWPLAAIAGLAEMIATDKRAPGAARSVLVALVPHHLAALPALTPWLSAAAVRLLDGLTGRLEAPADTADAAELPTVLANPPWLAPAKSASKPLALAPLTLAPVERWSAAERQRVLRERRLIVYTSGGTGFKAPNDAGLIAAGDVAGVVARWEAHRKAGYDICNSVHHMAKLPPPFNAAVWSAMAKYDINSPGHAIGSMGIDAIAGVAVMCERRPAEELKYAMYFGAVELAAPVARALAVLKARGARDMARNWLLANPEHAACGLIAPALGKTGAARDAAAGALRLLAANGHEAMLVEVAARYGQDAVNAALRAMLDEDPLDRFPSKIAALPAFWMPRSWARPQLAANGKPLPDQVLDLIGVMLRFPRADGVYAGIEQVRQACTPESLSQFAWDLFSAWADAGGDSKDNWAFTAMGLFGGDDCARKLTPLIRAWPGESQNARAIAGLDILAAIGTDLALMLLNGIAQKVKFKALQENAREKIGQIAQARGLSTDELEDRLAPDLGLDDDGTLLLDFGARQFRVGFDEALKPCVRDAHGARMADLPKPNKSDDAALSAAATERFKALKKDARSIADQQLIRLEVAMCTQRRWEPETFRRFLAGHPLVRHLVQRLVWGAYAMEADASHGGRLLGCFRVGADGEWTDAGDDAWQLPQGENIRIGIPHALDIPAPDAAGFGQLLADYELVQPFAQIGRDTYTLGADESAAHALKRWEGTGVPVERLLGLAHKGWRRGEPHDAGFVFDFNRPLGDGRVVELRFGPGLMLGSIMDSDDQVLELVVVGSAGAWGGIDKPQPLSTLSAIAASELIRDMEALCA